MFSFFNSSYLSFAQDVPSVDVSLYPMMAMIKFVSSNDGQDEEHGSSTICIVESYAVLDGHH